MTTFPYMLYATPNGELYDCPKLQMSVSSGGYDFLPYVGELIPLPEGSTLHYIDNSSAVGFNILEGKFEADSDKLAVHAKLPSEYLRLFLPSYRCSDDNMPEYIYTPVGWDSQSESIVTCGLQMDYKRDTDGKTNAMSSTKHVRKYPNNKIIGEFHKKIFANPDEIEHNFYPSVSERNIPITIITEDSDINELLELALSSTVNDNKKIVTITENRMNNITSENNTNSKAIDYLKAFKLIGMIKSKSRLVTVIYEPNLNNQKRLSEFISAGVDSVNIAINSVAEDDFICENVTSKCNFEDALKCFEIAKKGGVHIIMTLSTFPGVNDKKDSVTKLIEVINDYDIGTFLTKNKYINSHLKWNTNDDMQDIISLKNMLKEIYKKCKNTQLGAFVRSKSEYNIKSKLPKLK